MKRFLAWMALVACTASPVLAEGDDAKKKKRPGRAGRGGGQVSFFAADVQRAVPGIASLVQISPEQRKKLAEARKAALQGEEVQKALKTAKDKSADRQSRRQAQKTIREAQAKARASLAAVLSEDQRALVAKINGAAESVTQSLRGEHREKLKEVKGDKAARQKLTKELNAKIDAAVKAKVEALLSDEQKSKVAEAAKKRGKRGQKAGKGKKKEKDDSDKPAKKKRERRNKKDEKGEGEGKKKDKEA